MPENMAVYHLSRCRRIEGGCFIVAFEVEDCA